MNLRLDIAKISRGIHSFHPVIVPIGASGCRYAVSSCRSLKMTLRNSRSGVAHI
jgi:hypothetical protein